MAVYFGNWKDRKMKKLKIMLVAVVLLSAVNVALASVDTFGTGANQFTIDFVNISGDTNPSSGYGTVNNDYRIGRFEITNDQWDKFSDSYGVVTGYPPNAYDESPYFTGTNIPNNEVSWYEAAQFVNWLNTSTGHQAAYKFTGTKGTSNYTFTPWEVGDAGFDSTNPFRNSNAHYYMPTEDEWFKAAYWNGTNIQTYATKVGESLHQGDGISGTGWNYLDDNGTSTWSDDTGLNSPWDVGSGSEELNGTYDMMGNVMEWLESKYPSTRFDYLGVRGGASIYGTDDLSSSSDLYGTYPNSEDTFRGFRVASVPEPCSLVLLGLGAVVLRYRKHKE